MGTSVAMIDRTYGHLVKGSEETARSALDAAAELDVTRRRPARSDTADGPSGRSGLLAGTS